MCNLYAHMKARAEAGRLAKAFRDLNNNAPLQPGVYPDYSAPVVLKDDDGAPVMRDLRWGLPSSSKARREAAEKCAAGPQGQGQGIRLRGAAEAGA